MKTSPTLWIGLLALAMDCSARAFGSGSIDVIATEKVAVMAVTTQTNASPQAPATVSPQSNAASPPAFVPPTAQTHAAALPPPIASAPARPDVAESLEAANRIKVMVQNHQLQQALGAAEQETTDHPDVALSWYSLGDVFLSGQRAQDAIAPLQKAVAIDPKLGPALLDLGTSFAQTGKFDEAIDAYSRTIDQMPDYFPAWLALYQCYGAKHDLAGADNKFQGYVTANPKSANAWYMLGSIQMIQQLPDSAIDSWQKAVNLSPNFFEALKSLGLAYGNSKQPDKAIDCFTRAAAIRPDPEILNDLGFIYFAQGQQDKAIEAFKQALKQNPKYEKALINLTSAYAKQKQWELAKETARALAEVNPQSAAELSKTFPASDANAAPSPDSATTSAAAPSPAASPSPSQQIVPPGAPFVPPAMPAANPTTPAPTAATAQGGKVAAVTYDVAPPASWIKPLDPDAVTTPAATDAEGGVDYVLIDNQQLMDPTSNFTHYALRLVNEEGLEHGSDIRAGFDPNYQTLTLHWLKVKRDGAWQDRLATENFQMLRREENLDSQMLDGRYSVVCHLQDVRVGDTIDFAYTVKGANPVFGGKFLDSILTGFPKPVHLLSNQLIVAPNRQVYMKGFGHGKDPESTTLPDQSSLISWKQEEVPATPLEPRTSEWYDTLSWAEISEFASWKDVVDWGLATFSLNDTPSPELQSKIDEIAVHTSPEKRALEAIDFVQNDIRYLGIEMGANSYKPTPASQVFEHRFGDCKDKTQLCVVMLRALGIDAYPALVNTRREEQMAHLLPSPLAFDHAIVQLTLDNHTYWIDVTRSGQRGQLRDFYVDDFKYALPLKPGTTDLVPMEVSPSSMPQITVEETYKVKSVTDPVTLLIHKVFKGRSAEGVRSSFKVSSREEMEKAYLNYYARYNSQIKAEQPLRWQDFPDDNRFELWQDYTIPNFWTQDSPSTPYKASFVPFSIVDVVGSTTSSPRTTPYRLDHPTNVSEDMEIDLFRKWRLDTPPTQIQTPNFTFNEYSSLDDKTIRFKYHYETLAADVLPDKIDEYNDQIKKVRDRLECRLTYKPGADPAEGEAFRPNWMAITIASLVFGISAVAAIGVYFIRPRDGAIDMDYELHPYEGIGGWLIVICISIAVGIFYDVGTAALDLGVIFDLTKWNALTQPGSAGYDPYWAPSLLFESIAAIFLVVLLVLAIVLFFQKRFTFPYVMIAYLVLNAIYHAIDHSLASQVGYLASHDKGTFVQSMVYMVLRCAIWIPYLLVSKRVKATFRY